jgi:hypothetical protein
VAAGILPTVRGRGRLGANRQPRAPQRGAGGDNSKTKRVTFHGGGKESTSPEKKHDKICFPIGRDKSSIRGSIAVAGFDSGMELWEEILLMEFACKNPAVVEVLKNISHLTAVICICLSKMELPVINTQRLH